MWPLVLFAVFWAVIIYALNCLLAGTFKRIVPKTALVYFMIIALIGLFGEILLDSAYNFFVGHPLWYYNILPIYGGYTSSYAIVTWGLYGFHLYLLHDSLATKWSITRIKHLALLFSLEALVLEALLTLSAKFVFGRYLYYYLPSDLWHISSFQNIPFLFYLRRHCPKNTEAGPPGPCFLFAHERRSTHRAIARHPLTIKNPGSNPGFLATFTK